MINVSNLFKEKMADGVPVYEIVDITFSDGTKKTVQNEIMSGNNTFSDCAESSSFPIGATVCKSMTLELDNTEDQWKDYNFYQAKVHVYLKMQTSVAKEASTSPWMDNYYNQILDTDGNEILLTKEATEDRFETIDKGIYTITTPEQYGEILEFTALDDMYKANTQFKGSVNLPLSAMSVLLEVCSESEIRLGFSSLENNLIINEIPDNATCRQLIGWIAMINCANARVDNKGYLQFVKWNFREVENGTKIPIDLEDYVNFPTVSSDDIVITGIRLKNKNTDALFGNSGYVLEMENNLLSDDDLGTVASLIGANIVGARFRNLQGDLAYNPLLEFGDLAYTYDRNHNKYLTPITDVSSQLNGITTVKTQAEDPIRGSSTYNSAATKAIVEARQLVKVEKTEREKAIENLANRLASSSGLYMTAEPQEDGSNIYYMHNKPTLEESDTIWKLTAEAFAISIDGGKTYPYGFTVNGELITRLLYAEGINADYINSGIIQAVDKSGNITFMVDITTGRVLVNADSIQIKGKNVDTIAKEKAEAEVNDFISNTYTNDLNNLQSQIDGQIETFFYDYEPTLQNIPASEWTTSEERKKHEGDLFYWKTKGYAYRFMQDGAAWKWQMVQDTDITLALSAAEKAQDTADGKRRVFVVQPAPPYDIGDLWSQGTNGDLMRCKVSRASGTYNASDWEKASKYTDDSTFNVFLNGVFKDTVNSIKTQIDGKIETWYQPNDPSVNWTKTEQQPWTDSDGNTILDTSGNEIILTFDVEKYEHEGDLWHNTSDNTQWIYKDGKWKPQSIPDELLDKIDGKSSVYMVQPTPPYYMGDLWVTTNSEGKAALKTSMVNRVGGSFEESDWIDFKYADKDDIKDAINNYDTSLGQDEVFNKLTKGGTEQGIYIEDGKVYINAKYILAGTLAGERINGRGLKVIDNNKKVTLEIDSDGNITIAPKTFTLAGKTVDEIADNSSKSAVDGQTQTDIFNKLTKNGTAQGIYIDVKGNLYINGSFIKSLSVTTDALASNAITAEKVASNAITAEKIDVQELSALGATIGGYTIQNNRIYNDKNGLLQISMGNEYNSPALFARDSAGEYIKYSASGIVSSYATSLTLTPHNTTTESGFTDGSKHFLGRTQFGSDVSILGDFSVSGTKSIIADTESYGEQLFYCYETPTPTLGDFGGGVIGEDGIAIILIDDIFQESTDTEIEYYVFLQNEGEGQTWVAEKTNTYFTVKGTPGLHFAWELKAKQKNKEFIRFNAGKEDREVNFRLTDIEKEMFSEREKIIQEMEGALL